MAKILGAPIGEYVHVAGTLNFLPGLGTGLSDGVSWCRYTLKDVIGAIRRRIPMWLP